MKKLVKATDIYGIKEVAIAGGVSANSALRHQIISVGKELGWKTYIPKFEYCTDNAAMIGIAAHYKFLKNQVSPLDITPHPRLPF